MFGSKFANKCKQATKCIRVRVEPIRKKKQATLRFLKKDVADLLAAGQDDNAFGRIDALIVEINHESAYDTIERCCEYIVRQIPTLEKQRECSQEVMEVMGTIIFAAARFPGLPELCDLRHVFMERYGGDMQSSANAEFVEKIQKKTFSKEKKLQLMQSIAEEFSVRWDSQLFGHKLSDHLASKPDSSKKVMSSNKNDKPPSTLDNDKKVANKLDYTPASLPRRQELPREAKTVQVVSTPKNIPMHDAKEKTCKVLTYEPENVEQYARHPKVPSYVYSRSSYNVAHKEDEPRDTVHHRRAKAQYELNSVGQEKQGHGPIKYWDDKPAKLVPPYTKSRGNNDYNIKGTKAIGVPPYAKEDETKNFYPVKEKIESVLENVQLGHHEEISHTPAQGRNSVQPTNTNVRLTNMIPPYVKLKAKEVVQEDPLIRNSNFAAYDLSKDIEYRDDKMNADKHKPFSVRRNFRNVPNTETDNAPIYEEKPSTYDDGRRPTDKPSAIDDDFDRNNDENISIKHMRPPTDDEMINIVVNGIPMPQIFWAQRKEGNKHLADAYDGKFDETEIYVDKLSYHATGGRRYKTEQNISLHNERKNKTKNSRLSMNEDEADDAIDYGNLFSQASNRQRRHGSRRHAAVYDGGYDEEEMAMDRLLVHYSRKGTYRDPGKETRKNRIPAVPLSAANEHPSNGEFHSMRKHPNHLERALSVPLEPVGPEAIKAPVRALSIKPNMLAPNCGQVHPRLPDYDNLAAHLAALRQT